jgi:hypothetical protein
MQEFKERENAEEEHSRREGHKKTSTASTLLPVKKKSIM